MACLWHVRERKLFDKHYIYLFLVTTFAMAVIVLDNQILVCVFYCRYCFTKCITLFKHLLKRIMAEYGTFGLSYIFNLFTSKRLMNLKTGFTGKNISAFLTNCFAKRALRLNIVSENNHIRHFFLDLICQQ